MILNHNNKKKYDGSESRHDNISFIWPRLGHERVAFQIENRKKEKAQPILDQSIVHVPKKCT